MWLNYTITILFASKQRDRAGHPGHPCQKSPGDLFIGRQKQKEILFPEKTFLDNLMQLFAPRIS